MSIRILLPWVLITLPVGCVNVLGGPSFDVDLPAATLRQVIPRPAFADYQEFPGFTDILLDQATVSVTRLRCEYLQNPVGIDAMKPRLSWQVVSSGLGQRQTAYRILAAGSVDLLERETGDLWDSGKVTGTRMVNVPYEGLTLKSRQVVYWRVQVWDKDELQSAWSETAHWRMGLLHDSDWQAEYISYTDPTPVHNDPDRLFLPAARQYRKEFTVNRRIQRATIHATALGIYELHLNGSRVDDVLFAPGWTDYRRRAYYVTHEVTDLVQEGANALGAWVADGWYSGYVGFGLLTGIGTEQTGRSTYGKTPALKVQLEIELDDGTRQIIPTDGSWKVTGDGPIREADFLMGETYDARLEVSGWAEAGFDDSGWQSVVLASETGPVPATFWEYSNPEPGRSGPLKVAQSVDLGFKEPPQLQAFPGEPVRPVQEIKAVAIHEPQPGVTIFNMGQNFAGIIRFHGKGRAGQRVQFRFGEMVHSDGTLMTANLRKARARDTYIFKGNPDGETFIPRFTYHGFQFVEITGLDYKPNPDAVTGIVLMSDTPGASSFECSDPVINRLYQNTLWTQKANFIDLPTDCPQRDERMGWTGDAQIYIRAATYHADVAAFYSKWLRELMESQRPSGAFPGYAPFPFQHGWDFGTAWADAGIICPWTLWRVYDDTRIIEDCWVPMTRFMDWRRACMKEHLGIDHGNGWGDWLNQNDPTPLDYIDTVYLAYSAKLMSDMGMAIGRADEASEYLNLFNKVRSAFQARYLNADGSLNLHSQTAYALALAMDLIPEELRIQCGQGLASKIRENGTRMTTGFLGTRPLLPVLSSVGQHDLAVELLQSHRFPGWGYEVLQGATTLWERWDSYTLEHGFEGRSGNQNASMNSFSHYSFGAVVEWMFFKLAGIEMVEPGFKHILIQPSPPSPGSHSDRKPIDWVKASYDSIHGRIISEWRLRDGKLETLISIPSNTKATLKIPAIDPATIEEEGIPLKSVEGARFVGMENHRAVVDLVPGTYRFSSRFPGSF